jgi:hypothetical protein
MDRRFLFLFVFLKEKNKATCKRTVDSPNASHQSTPNASIIANPSFPKASTSSYIVVNPLNETGTPPVMILHDLSSFMIVKAMPKAHQSINPMNQIFKPLDVPYIDRVKGKQEAAIRSRAFVSLFMAAKGLFLTAAVVRKEMNIKETFVPEQCNESDAKQRGQG